MKDDKSKQVAVISSAYLSTKYQFTVQDGGAVSKSGAGGVGAHTHRDVDGLGWCRNVQEAPVYRPSVEEFEDPVSFIRSIKAEAERFGICKIIPPVQASTPCFDALRRDVGHTGAIGSLKLTTRQQLIGNLEWEDWDQNRFWTAPERNLKGFHQQAENTAVKVFGTSLQMPVRKVEVCSPALHLGFREECCSGNRMHGLPSGLNDSSHIAGGVLDKNDQAMQGHFYRFLCGIRGQH